MNWLGFFLFLVLALILIWNGKDRYDKKDWLFCGLMLICVLVGTLIIGFIFRWLSESWSLFSLERAQQLAAVWSMSFLCLWGVKLVITLLVAIFSYIMKFHKTHNAENYPKITSTTDRFGPPLLVVAKVFVSLASFLMFYGLWLD